MVRWLLISVLLLSQSVFAGELNPEQEATYNHLLYETRCVTCLNQNLNDSNAPVAQAMREQILVQVQQGQSEQEIRDFLIGRYGEFVSFRPSLNKKTYPLWFIPIMLCLFGCWVVMKNARRSHP